MANVQVASEFVFLTGSFMVAITLGLIGWCLTSIIRLGLLVAQLQQQMADLIKEHKELWEFSHKMHPPSGGYPGAGR